MSEISSSRLRDALARTIGPTPWYWKTFPRVNSASGQRFAWTHHGSEGPLGYVISLALVQEPDKPRLALNTYCRPFFVPPSHLGIWCPEGRSIGSRALILTSLKLSIWQKSPDGSSNRQNGFTLPLLQSPILRFRLVSMLACTSLKSQLRCGRWMS